MPLAWPVIKDLLELRDRLNNFFEETLLDEVSAVGEPTNAPYCPAADFYETEREIVAIVEAPGVEERSVEVKLHDNTLVVTGHVPPSRAPDDDGRYVRLERASGSFYRVFNLPTELSEAEPEAALARGVLTVRLAKANAAKRRRVPIIEERS